MAAGGIRIPFLADVAAFLRGTDNVTDALDDVSDALDDLATEAQRAGRETGDDLAKGVERGTDRGSDEVEKLERSFREMSDVAKREGRRAGDEVGDSVTRGTERASDGMDALKENTASNAKEMGGSFQDVESALDAVQGLAAEALEGFGPAGIAAGVAAAAGIGVAVQMLQQAADKANELTETAADLATSFGEAGTESEQLALLRDRWAEVGDQIADVRSLWEVWQDRAVTNIERIATAAKYGQVDVAALFDAFVQTDPTQRLRELSELLDDARRAQAAVNDEALAGPRPEAEVRTYRARREAIGSVVTVLQDEVATQGAANAIAEARARAAGQTVAAYNAEQEAIAEATAAQEAYGAALEATADPVATYQDILKAKEDAERATAEATAAATADATDSWQDYAGAVTVTTDELIAEWNRQAEQAAAFEANLSAIAAAGGQAMADELRAKGPEVAGAVAETIAQADPAKQREAIDAHARATGGAMGKSMAGGITDQQSAVQGAVDGIASRLTPAHIPIKVTVDSSAWDNWTPRAKSSTVTPWFPAAAAGGYGKAYG